MRSRSSFAVQFSGANGNQRLQPVIPHVSSRACGLGAMTRITSCVVCQFSTHGKASLLPYSLLQNLTSLNVRLIHWNPHLLKNANALERFQRHFAKRIIVLRNLSYGERLASLELDTLECRRLKAALILYDKIMHNLTPWPIERYFNMSVAWVVYTVHILEDS